MPILAKKKVIFSDEALFDLGGYVNKHGNVAECVRKLRTDFGRRESPSVPYVRYLVKKLKETGMLIDKPMREKPINNAYTLEYCV